MHGDGTFGIEATHSHWFPGAWDLSVQCSQSAPDISTSVTVFTSQNNQKKWLNDRSCFILVPSLGIVKLWLIFGGVWRNRRVQSFRHEMSRVHAASLRPATNTMSLCLSMRLVQHHFKKTLKCCAMFQWQSARSVSGVSHFKAKQDASLFTSQTQRPKTRAFQQAAHASEKAICPEVMCFKVFATAHGFLLWSFWGSEIQGYWRIVKA